MPKIISMLLFSLFLAGCAQQYTIKNSFDAREVSWVKSQGKNTIDGEAFLRTNGGEVRTCAGAPVIIVPISTYSTERVLAIYNNSEKGYRPAFGSGSGFANDDPRFYEYTIRSMCDSTGHFRFKNVPDGSFYVIGSVTWQISPYVVEGGRLMQKVRVSSGQTKEIIMSF